MPLFVLLLVACRGGTVTQLPAVQPVDLGSDEPAAARLVLIGDAGYASFDKSGNKLVEHDPVLAAAETLAKQGPAQTAVLFLGDNVYGRKPRFPRAYGGMPPCEGPDCWDAAIAGRSDLLEHKQLLEQLDVSRAGKPVWFLLGNHDWYQGVAGVRAQVDLIDAYAAAHGRTVELLPRLEGRREANCSGASAVAVRRLGSIGVVMLDTQAAMRCPAEHATLRKRLWDAVEALNTPVTVVAGHHPATSYGPHGKRARSTLFTRQDIPARRYRAFIENTLVAPEGFDHTDRFLVYAAGHEHVLQVLEPKDLENSFDVMVVSGAGSFVHSKSKEFFFVPPPNDSREMTSNEAGLVTLDVTLDGDVELTVVEVSSDGTTARRSWSADPDRTPAEHPLPVAEPE